MPVLLSSLRTPVSQAMALPEPLKSGLSPLGSPGVPWHPQILADQLTLFQLGGTNYAHLITTCTPGFLDLPTALEMMVMMKPDALQRAAIWKSVEL